MPVAERFSTSEFEPKQRHGGVSRWSSQRGVTAPRPPPGIDDVADLVGDLGRASARERPPSASRRTACRRGARRARRGEGLRVEDPPGRAAADPAAEPATRRLRRASARRVSVFPLQRWKPFRHLTHAPRPCHRLCDLDTALVRSLRLLLGRRSRSVIVLRTEDDEVLRVHTRHQPRCRPLTELPRAEPIRTGLVSTWAVLGGGRPYTRRARTSASSPCSFRRGGATVVTATSPSRLFTAPSLCERVWS